MDSCDSNGRSLTKEYILDDTDAYHPFCFRYR